MLYCSSMKTPSIVIVGHICIDHNTTESKTYTSWGSGVLYMAQYFQRTHHLQPVAVTNYGPDILPHLPAVSLLPANPTQPQTLVYENDTRTHPRVWRAHNTGWAGEPALTSEVIQAIQSADIIILAVLLSNYTPGYIRQLLSYARPEALRMLCPQGFFRHVEADGLVVPRQFKEAGAVVPLFDVVVYSEEDHPAALDIAKTWKQTMDTEIVVTRGANGASIVEKDQVIHVPTTPLTPEEIVDSVGCGDVFAATLIHALYVSKDVHKAIVEAHQAARRKLLDTPVII
jgi:hypothetical protein